ncbi:MAG: hypothetical protein HS111_28900 [Kofleriaceae bacterium]|nr:hypothetical protein [Kofleriaceae bacterium]
MDLAAVHAVVAGQRAYWRKRLIADGADPDSPDGRAEIEDLLKHPAERNPHFDHDPDDD